MKASFQECVVFNPSLHKCISVICNFPFIFIFYSCFQNSQIQMSCFRTWILLTCQAIAMMTFCLSLRTTETVYSPIPFTCSHVCGCTARNLNTPFPQKKKKLTSWSNGALPAFFILELLLSASKTAKVTGEKIDKKCSNLRVCRATHHNEA